MRPELKHLWYSFKLIFYFKFTGSHLPGSCTALTRNGLGWRMGITRKNKSEWLVLTIHHIFSSRFTFCVVNRDLGGVLICGFFFWRLLRKNLNFLRHDKRAILWYCEDRRALCPPVFIFSNTVPKVLRESMGTKERYAGLLDLLECCRAGELSYFWP